MRPNGSQWVLRGHKGAKGKAKLRLIPNVNVILHFTTYVKREVVEWQFSLCFGILSENSEYFGVIFYEIAEITRFGHEQNFAT